MSLVMHINKPITPLKQYFKDHKISCKQAAKDLGMSLNSLYSILNGARPNFERSKMIHAYINGELTMKQIRPDLDKPRCEGCGRLLKKHHLVKQEIEKNKANRKKKALEEKKKKTAKKHIKKKKISQEKPDTNWDSF